MDHFGICHAAQSVLEIYFRSGKGTGRTTSLVQSVKDGDRVVFVDIRQARQFERLCKERGVEPETHSCPASEAHRLVDRPSVPGYGRLILDHVWVEEYLRQAMQQACNDITRLQTQMSGDGAPHRETRRKAHEMARWR